MGKRLSICSYLIYSLLGIATSMCGAYWGFKYLLEGSAVFLAYSICSFGACAGLCSLIVIDSRIDCRNVVPVMTFEEFMETCTLHSGNWSETLLDGVRKMYPAKYENVAVRCHAIVAQYGDIQGVQFLCGWLKDQGISFDHENQQIRKVSHSEALRDVSLFIVQICAMVVFTVVTMYFAIVVACAEDNLSFIGGCIVLNSVVYFIGRKPLKVLFRLIKSVKKVGCYYGC